MCSIMAAVQVRSDSAARSFWNHGEHDSSQGGQEHAKTHHNAGGHGHGARRLGDWREHLTRLAEELDPPLALMMLDSWGDHHTSTLGRESPTASAVLGSRLDRYNCPEEGDACRPGSQFFMPLLPLLRRNNLLNAQKAHA